MTHLTPIIGFAAAIALLPTSASALPSLEEINDQPTSLEPWPEVVESVPETEVAEGIAAELSEGMPEDESPAVVSADVMSPETQVAESAQTADATAGESVNPEATPNSDLSNEAQGADPRLTEDPWLPLSTSSRDLQRTEASLVSEDLLPTPLDQPLDVAQTTAESSPSDKWHFLLTPYIYIPFSISGSANFNNLNSNQGGSGGGINFDLEPNQIRTALRNNLNFALFSGFEAWNPNYKLGILSNFDYVSLSTESTVDRDVRFPGLANFIPAQINAALTTQLMRADLAGSYRFYDPARVNPEGIRSEYDLGPFVFDVLGGLSLTQVNTRLGLSTNLGGSGQFNDSRTVVSPLIGGRVRWNANPKFALVGTGTISGFGIGGLMQYGLQGGLDWMFSGDTTLGAGYRFGFTDYNTDRVDLNIDQHGPYINIGFRF
ncbi:hypothetical protein [Phormidium sp. FACHB-1136]|uniref:hypothetical protein n=1 Tax=Phormidium sp. FACHB-1136 TaxID=2692848 RepID=UPI0016885553|nr:hypothetical protein [Phormidium sp. FACHB-1136]MBD2425688.1 hypothetical protein [Phormidium sp. FACHB-1136]